MSFINDIETQYLNEFIDFERRIKYVFEDSFNKADISTALFVYKKYLEHPIKNLQNFNNSQMKINELYCNLEVIEKTIQSFTLSSKKTKLYYEPIQKAVDELIEHYMTSLIRVNDELSKVFSEIETCPRGKKELGKIFEKLILEFFDLLFIHELIRNDRPKRFKKVLLDGFYHKLDNFDAKKRIGFDFQQLILECKNKKPNINDFMQCFKYTLYFQSSEISKIPLTLLICRESPGLNSTIWKLNKTVFDKRIDNETRLIMMLNLKDLEDMKKYKIEGSDPMKVLKEKIETYFSTI